MRSIASSRALSSGGDALKRRDFVKTIILCAATSGSGGSKWLGHFFAEASAADVPFPLGPFSFRVSDFPDLATDLGSVAMEVPGIPNILVTRLAAGEFVAVTSVCTHQGCTVSPYSATFGGMHCPCHRSLFNPDGTVAHGPAVEPLYRFKLAYDGKDLITLDLVKFSYLITGDLVPVSKGISQRFGITFQTELSNNYTVVFKASPAAADWTQVSFSQTVTGRATDGIFQGTGEPVTLYLDITQSAGIFSVARYRQLGG